MEGEQQLPQSLEFYRRMLEAQSEVQPSISLSSLPLTEKEARQYIKQGTPLLNWENLTFNWKAFQTLLAKVTGLIIETLSPTSEEVDTLNQLTADQIYLERIAKTWFEYGTPLSEKTTLDEEIDALVASAIHASFQPFLAAYSEKLLQWVDQESWHRRYCPVCGGEADFASLDKERGARQLLCSRCDAQWLYYRLRCPYCSNQDRNSLAYFGDDKSLYRLYVCEKCHRYLKTIDLRKTESEVLLPLERILTLDMDRQAYEKGYRTAS